MRKKGQIKMNIFQTIKYKVKYLLSGIQCKIDNFILTRKYPDYKDNEYNCGELKFIWGIKSWDDLSESNACMYTINDIEIDYDRKTKEYVLGVEPIYQFENGKSDKAEYLDGLLLTFTKYMEENNYHYMDEPFDFWSCQSVNFWRAKDILTLYTQFRLFVEGYKALYKNNEQN